MHLHNLLDSSAGFLFAGCNSYFFSSSRAPCPYDSCRKVCTLNESKTEIQAFLLQPVKLQFSRWVSPIFFPFFLNSWRITYQENTFPASPSCHEDEWTFMAVSTRPWSKNPWILLLVLTSSPCTFLVSSMDFNTSQFLPLFPELGYCSICVIGLKTQTHWWFIVL